MSTLKELIIQMIVDHERKLADARAREIIKTSPPVVYPPRNLA